MVASDFIRRQIFSIKEKFILHQRSHESPFQNRDLTIKHVRWEMGVLRDGVFRQRGLQSSSSPMLGWRMVRGMSLNLTRSVFRAFCSLQCAF